MSAAVDKVGREAVALAQTLAPRHVAMISLGGVIGAGLFVGGSGAIAKAGPGVVVTYAACGTLIFFIMRMLGEMAVARPGRGTFVSYGALALGPWAGFVIGWLYWYFWVFTVGAETVAGAKLLQAAGVAAPLWAIGAVLVVGLTATNLLSVRAFGELEFWFAVIKVAAIAAFILLGAAYLLFVRRATALDVLLDNGGLIPRGLGGLVAAVPIAIFSMMGSEVAAIAAAESSDPAANVTRAARSVALRVLVFYVLSVLVIVSVRPWTAVTPGATPFTPALEAIGVPGSSAVMAMVIITAVLSCLNSGLYITSRMLHELALRGDAPAFLGRTGAVRVPVAGTLIGCAAGFAAALAQIFLREDLFTLLAATSGDIILFIYLLITLAQIKHRRAADAAGLRLESAMWGFPWLSYAVVAGIAAVLIELAFIPGERTTLIASAVTVGLVFAAQGVRARRVAAPAAG